MPDTRRTMRTIESVHADPQLVASLLSARSDAQAMVAFTQLREELAEAELLELANLRELIVELPSGAFRTGESLEILERAGGYECTGRSYRRLFDSPHGVFGVEFLGQVRTCERIVVHTPNGRWALASCPEKKCLDDSVLTLLVGHRILLDAVLEALELLGCPLDPLIYLRADDFLAEHAGQAMCEAMSDLF